MIDLEEARNVLILEEASLELLPRRLRTHQSAKRIEQSFGVKPELQILDSNFHGPAMLNLEDREKRGRPDVAHFALLDATSTPLFSNGKVKVVIHSLSGTVITLKSGTRLPRTLNRFCGVMAKLLASKIGEAEEKLFEVSGKASFQELLASLEIEKTVSLTKLGTPSNLQEVVGTMSGSKRTAWVVGGFAHGHFRPDVIANSEKIISISNASLTAHVVTARLCYALEKSLGI